MILQDKIDLFIIKAQSKIADIAIMTAADLNDSLSSSEEVKLACDLLDALTSLQDDLLDWSNYDKESVIDYYTVLARLNDVAILDLTDKSTVINGQSGDTSWVPSFNLLNAKVEQYKDELDNEIIRLDDRIDNLDFSNLVPQDLLDEVADNSNARHTHDNKTILDSITQGDLDAINNNTNHRNDGTVHVTSAQKTVWDAKVSQQQLTDGLSGKSDIGHIHEIAEVTGLTEALDGLAPEKGEQGDPGITPILQAGIIADGEFSVQVDNTDPEFPILNFTIPAGQDGEDFHIDVYGNASGRLNSIYNDSPEGYSFLGLDNGTLYFRRPFDSVGNPLPATSTAGWYSTKFMGDNGWSPVLGTLVVSDTKTVMVLVGWAGGEGTAPSFGTPGQPVYLGPNGFTQILSEATNIKGNVGEKGDTGKALFPDASGTLIDRNSYDGELKEFMFYDIESGLMYIKLSDSVADWSVGYQWRGDQGEQGEPGPPGADGNGTSWSISYVNSDVNPAQPHTYYVVDATATPVTIYLPDPIADSDDEFSIEMNINTHKVTITTVNNITNAIGGVTTKVIPNVGGRVSLKCNGLLGYIITNDTRNMKMNIPITADRDFTTDGFEHMSSYKITPNPSGSAVLLTLPPPSTFDQSKTINASFTLSGPGSITIVRSDSGLIGKSNQQIVDTVGSTVTIEEGEGIYSIIQDSRPKSSTVLEFPFYRLTDDSDIVGYKALSLSKTDPRYGAEQELVTGPIGDGAAANYVSYISDLGFEIGDIPASNVVFSVTTKLTTTYNRDVVAYYELYKRTAAGSETLLTTSPPFIITQIIYSQFNVIAQLPTTSFGTGDRLVMKVWVQKSSDGQDNPALTTKVEGTNGAFFSIQVPASEARHSILQGRDDAHQHPATAIDYDNSTSGLIADTVQNAVNEIVGWFRNIANTFKGFFNWESLTADRTITWQDKSITVAGLDDIDITRQRNTLAVATNNINLDWNSKNELVSNNRVSVTANATITYLNFTNAEFATFKVDITNLATLTFPSGSISLDINWNTLVWAPPSNGKFTISIYKTGIEYEVIFTQTAAV
ncbi:hypothetical protein [Tenacibaculum sp.]|uniref:hypothetical protein n=1 Tax=Tenacibaculum sp. TaxID=1906242 RepID=UPI003D0E3D14